MKGLDCLFFFEGKPLCNSHFQPTSKNYITIFQGLGRDHQFSGFLPILKLCPIKILKTAEHFLEKTLMFL